MAGEITQTELQNARLDAITLAQAVTTNATITPRTGSAFSSIPKLIADSQAPLDAAADTAANWAALTGALVNTTDYSSKEWAIGLTVPSGSAKEWADKTGGAVTTTTTDRSAKAWAQDNLKGVTLGGSSKDWAVFASGNVDGTEYSSKAYAISLGVISSGSSKEWAVKNGAATVNGSNYSASAWASYIGGPLVSGLFSARGFASSEGLVATGSAKEWADKTGGAVTTTTTDRSAKAWAQDNLKGVTLGGSSKDWAIFASGNVDGTEYSSKAYAISLGVISSGSAKEWADKTGGAVTTTTTDRSAKAWAQDNLKGVTLGGSSKDWAVTTEDVAISNGQFSSFHYSRKSAASAADAEASAADAEASIAGSRYIGPFADDAAAIAAAGASLQEGNFYFNTTAKEQRYFNGIDFTITGAPISTVGVSSGGTGATTSAGARAALDVARKRIYDVTDAPYGARGDGVVGFDGVATSGDATFTDSSANFTSDLIGKEITIFGASAGGFLYSGTVSSINSPTSLELSSNAAFSISRAIYSIGTSSADEFNALQGAIDAAGAAGGGVVFVPYPGDGKAYRIGEALRMRHPNVTIMLQTPETHVHCCGVSQTAGLSNFPNNSPILLGSWISSDLQRTTDYAVSSVSEGDEKVTTSTAGNAVNFAVGDAILIKSTTTWNVSVGNTRPLWGQINVVESVNSSTGDIYLRHPVTDTGAAEITNLTQPGFNWQDSDGDDSGETAFAARDCAIIGGTWSSIVDEAPLYGAGGAVDCVVDVHRVICRNGVGYGNLNGYCTFRARHERVRKVPVELAWCSHDNIVEVLVAECADKSSGWTSAGPLVWINEGARRNLIRYRTIRGSDFAVNAGVGFTQSRNNTVEIDELYCEGATGEVVQFKDLNYTGTRPDCELNTVKIGKVYGGTGVDYFVRFGDNRTQSGKNQVIGGKFFGTPGTNAIFFNGPADNEDRVESAWFESGGISTNATSNNHGVVDSYVPEGLTRNGFIWDAEIQNGNYRMETSKSRLLRQVNKVQVALSNADDGSPYSFSSTVKGGAFDFGDTVSFFAVCRILNASSASDKTFALSFGGTTVFSYVSNATTETHVTVSAKISYLSASAVMVQYQIWAAGALAAGGATQIGGLTLANDTNLDFDVSVTASSGDTINIRHAQTVANSMSAGMPMFM